MKWFFGLWLDARNVHEMAKHRKKLEIFFQTFMRFSIRIIHDVEWVLIEAIQIHWIYEH